MDHGAPVAYLAFEPGADVVSSDGEVVGKVEHVLADPERDIFDGLVVATGFFSTTYVPAERVSGIVEGRIDLALSKDELEALDERPPAGPA
jgi:uncharacterized protein YrrD